MAISGDCSLPDLGISPADRATLIREVSIVFHVAATVRFDEKLKLAVAINVQSPRDILNLCKEMPQLKVSEKQSFNIKFVKFIYVINQNICLICLNKFNISS